jgi:hypothetical protein
MIILETTIVQMRVMSWYIVVLYSSSTMYSWIGVVGVGDARAGT